MIEILPKKEDVFEHKEYVNGQLLNFRNENGFDKANERHAQNILNSIGLLSGTQFPIPKLSFEPSILHFRECNLFIPNTNLGLKKAEDQ